MSATALSRNLFVCEVCGQLNRGIEGHCHCARCNANLHGRTPNSIRRAWAFLAAAVILYIPANILPILHTGNLFGGTRTDTIMSGVVHLWETGSAGLAIIVFVASIVIPFAKILSLGFCSSPRSGARSGSRSCARGSIAPRTGSGAGR